MIAQLRDANLQYLDQAEALLSRLDDAMYVRRTEGVSSVGAHLRHILDHYTAFNEGVGAGAVDYDDRQRDPVVEQKVEAALRALRTIRGNLGTLDCDTDVTLKVKMDDGGPDVPWSGSSVLRELQFLVSHTVHHFALIKVALRQSNIDVDDDFGVAPSTLAYRSEQACAQ